MFTALVAGQAAGLVMLSAAMFLSAVRGKSPLYPLQVFTALIQGEPSLRRLSVSSVLPGFLAHQAGPSVLWSRLFGLVVGLSRRHFSLTLALLVGVLVGAIALVVDGYVLMPGIQQQLHGHNLWAENVPRWVAWTTHLVYGSSLGFFYWRWQLPPCSSTLK
jgi:hypothetical protein